jgi:hypothetical protein
MNPYASLCDDFGAYVYLSTKNGPPNSQNRSSISLIPCKRAFPVLTDFDHRDSGDYVLEEDREQGSHRWVTLETRRLCAGYLNPPSLDAADQFHEHVLETAPYHLDLSGLDCEALDVAFMRSTSCTRATTTRSWPRL